MLPSIFTKGHIHFKVDADDFEFIHQSISVFGVTGLPWGKLDPKMHFGREVMAEIKIPSPREVTIKTKAYIMREFTTSGFFMGLKFQLDEDGKKRLTQAVKESGFYPSEYLRKYPRIPADAAISTFPLRALGMPESSGLGGVDEDEMPMILDVSNISPNGLMLSTENSRAATLAPDQILNLMIEPRGWFPTPIKAQGIICRVVDELHPQSGNLLRYLGIKITRMDDTNRAAFLDLLKDILSRIKDKT